MRTPPGVRERFPMTDNVWVRVLHHNPETGLYTYAEDFTLHNLITTAGKNLVADLIIDPAVNTVEYFGVGTGGAAAVIGDTALAAEVLRDPLTSSSRASVGILTLRYFLGTGSANGNTLAEIGLFTASSGGTMMARAVLSPTIVKDVTKAVIFTWTVTIG